MKKTFAIEMNLMSPTLSKIVFLCLLLMVGFHSASARKIFSKSPGGNWTSTGSWTAGIVPAANDTVYIQGGHTISVSSNEGSNSTYMFLIVIGTLDLSNNGKLSLSGSSYVIIENSGRILGNSNGDQISIGTGGSEYSGGSQGNITGPSYVGNGHTPSSGEGTAGCGCYNSVSSCTLISSDGYTVYVSVSANSLVKPATCPFGYNYNVKLDYNISFSGSNIPAGGLYTLQGNITCGSQPIFFDLPNTAGSGTITTTGNPFRSNTDCATATVASLGCTSAVLNIEGPGIGATTCSSSTLPIKLISFTSQSTENGVELNWKTSMEENFDYFLLERASTDLNFQPIAKIQGQGGLDIIATYSHLDNAPINGKNYYRLKSVDFDLYYDYSDVIYAEWDYDFQKSEVTVYPNPISDHSFTLELNREITAETSMSLLNSMGTEITHKPILNNKEIITLQNNLKSGVYFLKITGSDFNRTIKVFIP